MSALQDFVRSIDPIMLVAVTIAIPVGVAALLDKRRDRAQRRRARGEMDVIAREEITAVPGKLAGGEA